MSDKKVNLTQVIIGIFAAIGTISTIAAAFFQPEEFRACLRLDLAKCPLFSSSDPSVEASSDPNLPSSEENLEKESAPPETSNRSSTYLQQPLPSLKQGMEYRKARDMLIEQGWQAQIPASSGLYPDTSDPVIKNLVNKGYLEVKSCSGTGLGLCQFEFRNATGEILFVTTANNDPRLKENIVFNWYLDNK